MYAPRRPRWIRTIVIGVVIVGAAVALGAWYVGYRPTLPTRSAVTATLGNGEVARAVASLDVAPIARMERVDSGGGLHVLHDDMAVIAAADSAAGDDVYRRVGRCLGCHGANGEGAQALAPSLRDRSAVTTSLDSIRAVITEGRPSSPMYRLMMPAYADQLTAEQLARVTAFVYALSHPGRVTADSTPAASQSAPRVVP